MQKNIPLILLILLITLFTGCSNKDEAADTKANEKKKALNRH